MRTLAILFLSFLALCGLVLGGYAIVVGFVMPLLRH